MHKAYDLVLKLSKGCHSFRSSAINLQTQSSVKQTFSSINSNDSLVVDDKNKQTHLITSFSQPKNNNSSYSKFTQTTTSRTTNNCETEVGNFLGISCILAAVGQGYRLWFNWPETKHLNNVVEINKNYIPSLSHLSNYLFPQSSLVIFYTRPPLDLQESPSENESFAGDNDNISSCSSISSISSGVSVTKSTSIKLENSSNSTTTTLSDTDTSVTQENQSSLANETDTSSIFHSLFAAVYFNSLGVSSIEKSKTFEDFNAKGILSSICHAQQVTAEDCWRHANLLHPNSIGYPPAHYNLGSLYHRRARKAILDNHKMKFMKKAEQHYRLAIQCSNGQHFSAIYHLAVLLLDEQTTKMDKNKIKKESTLSRKIEAMNLMKQAADGGIDPAKEFLRKQAVKRLDSFNSTSENQHCKIRSNASSPNFCEFIQQEKVVHFGLRRNKTFLHLSNTYDMKQNRI